LIPWSTYHVPAARLKATTLMNFHETSNESDVTAPSDIILKIANLTHVYSGQIRALDNISLNIPYGMYGLLGPNGAGKSTLMRIIATLQKPTAGQILFEGDDILKEPAKIRQVLGYLPQEFGVYPRISAEALLDHIAVLKGVGPAALRREQIRELLHRTNLYDVRDRKVASFSGGMRQRFGIAQALLGAPRILIADEPTAGLDPAERARFHDLLSEIGEKIVIMLSTHILEDVAKLCSRLAILFEGRLVAEGETSALVAGLRGRVWQKEISRAELAELKTSVKLLSVRYHEGRAYAHILSDQAPGDGFQPIDGDLQDLYFAMTEERN
jgi:ABC-type multidrug transport system ATPase subunit